VTGDDSTPAKIVLVAGKMRVSDRVGHHDYRGGCALLASLLQQTPGVTAITADDWPENDEILGAARAIVCYTAGARKHAFVRSPQRLERMQELVDQGAGLVMIHQAVRYPPELAGLAMSWTGGVHVLGKAGRGHWPTHHREFPDHPVTRGVQPWKIKDGWMNEIEFTEGMNGVTPLVWAGRKYGGSSEGGLADVVSWTYERPDGGRAFCFTGLDAHSAWAVPGVRQLVVNGVLWSAGLTVPLIGAPCDVDDADLRSYLTPRGSGRAVVLEAALRRIRSWGSRLP
jgi:hypothetical protein